MAHFAQLDAGNIVGDVIVISNADCGGGDFPASEPIGQAFINGPHPDGLYRWQAIGCRLPILVRLGAPSLAGFSYDPVADVFIPPAAPEATP
jgi:hypothetical protein